MEIIELFSCIAIILALAIIFSCMIYERKTGVPSVPTLPWVRKKIVEAMKQHIKREDSYQVAELGCGWGGINLYLAREFPNATITGYEISHFPYFFSKMRAYFCDKRIKIIRKSFFEDELGEFDVLVCYLSPPILEKLKPQLALLKPGSLIISNAFAIPGVEPLETLHTHVGMKIPIYVYRT